MSNVELLAPAGNSDSLRTAVINGANAVYLGLDKYSARAKAFNFDFNELKTALEFAHLYGVRVYVALNTLIKNSEFEEVLNSARTAYELGADAFIVQDIGLLLELKKTLPYAEIHASTQMGVHNADGAKVLEELGVKRVILSRETTLSDISAIKKATNLEIEFFVHGAMCISFSGNCYFSGLVTGNSGNRGQCLQFCRKQYTLNCNGQNKKGYMLSAKDLMLLNDLDKLIDAGVDSFKIEGRMRRSAYVGETVRAYRNAIDCINENAENKTLKEDIRRLKSMFNRGDYCTAHLFQPTENIVYPYVNGHTGLKIGKVEQVFGGQAVINSEKKLRNGDGIKFIRDNTEVGSAAITSDTNVTGFSGKIKAGDEVFLTTDSELIRETESRKNYLIAKVHGRFKIGEPAELKLYYKDTSVVEKTTSVVQSAIKAPIDKDRISEILTAQSDEVFNLLPENLIVDSNIFISVAEIKNLKRAAICSLKNKIIENFEKNMQNRATVSDVTFNFPQFVYNSDGEKQIFVQIENLESLESLKAYDNTIDYYVLNPEKYDLKIATAFADKCGKRAILNLPDVARNADISTLRQIVENSRINRFIANNPYALNLCRNKNVLLGFMMNSINDKIQCEKIISPEKGSFDNQAVNYIFGKLPVMTFCHCTKKNLTATGCENCNGYSASLQDELGNVFPIRRYKINSCYSNLLNSVPIYLADKAKANGTKKIFIDFTGFEQNEIKNLAECVFTGNIPNFKYTRGYFNKKLR